MTKYLTLAFGGHRTLPVGILGSLSNEVKNSSNKASHALWIYGIFMKTFRDWRELQEEYGLRDAKLGSYEALKRMILIA